MPKRKSLKCPKCSRKFSMPAHLARHQKSIHGMAGTRKAAGAKVVKAKRRVARPKRIRVKVAPRRGTPAIAAFGGEAARILREIQSHHGELASQRIALDAQLDALARAIDAFGPAKTVAPARKRKYAKKGRPVAARPRRKAKAKAKPSAAAGRPGSLKDYIVRVLSQTSKPLSPREMGTAAIKAGFKTKSKDLTKAVSNTLPKMKGVKKIGFGKYQIAGR